MLTVKIIRGTYNNQHIYAKDDKHGKAEIGIYAWQDYIKALDVVNKTEAEIDRQYAILNGH